MKEKKFNYGWIIAIIILIVLFIPIISDYVKSQNIEVVSLEDVNVKIDSDESFLVYVGELDKSTKKELRKMREKTKNDYSYDYGVYNLETEEDINDILGENTKVALIIEGDIQKVYTKYDQASIDEDVDVYLVNDIDDSNRSYKVFEDFSAYKSAIKSKEINMIVFGRDNCSYCNLFKPVYNAVANKYNLDIYYFDSNNYDADEYQKVINYDLTVPAKCGSTGEDFKLSDGFGTPLTIFTKKGKIVDCIGGYKNRNDLIEILKSVEMISE